MTTVMWMTKTVTMIMLIHTTCIIYSFMIHHCI